MKALNFRILSVFLFLNLAGFSQNSSEKFDRMVNRLLKHSVPEINIDSVQKCEAVLLDSRELNEYNVSHIPNALYVGYDNFKSSYLNNLPMDTMIVVYCSVGYRSEKIAEKLIGLGYRNVYNMPGGIFDWVNNDLPIEDSRGKTDNVHPYNKNWGKWLYKGNKVLK